jgi:DNA-binding response OmpR family regulator
VKTRILIADDEARMRRLIADFLLFEGFEVCEAENGVQAVELVRKGEVGLVIMDVMMPMMDGLEASREIREFSEVPIMMLTAKSEEEDELSGFQSGADEYVSKPFSIPVLIMRVKALLRRRADGREEVLNVCGITIDQKAHTVTIGGKNIELTPREFELLTFLALNRNIALSRERLIDKIWGYDYAGDLRTVDTHIKNLRMKIEPHGDSIRTIRGYGYKMEDQNP